MSKVLGIDLGTTNSVVAVMDGGERTVIVNQEGAQRGGAAPSRLRLRACPQTSLCPNRLRLPMERVDDAVLHAIVDQVLTDCCRSDRRKRATIGRSIAELRAPLQSVERETSNVTRAIAGGGELDELRDCQKRRDELRTALNRRERVQGHGRGVQQKWYRYGDSNPGSVVENHVS